MKMTEIIVGALIAAALFVGGIFTGRATKVTEEVEYVDVDSTTRIENRQDTRTDVMQGQITIIFNDAITNQVVNVSFENLTNVSVSYSTNTNAHYSLTNRR